MKVLIDSCMAGSVSTALAEAGHDVECVVDWPKDPGDAAVLSHAQNTGQVVLTLDKDFGELIVRAGPASLWRDSARWLHGRSTGGRRCRGTESLRRRVDPRFTHYRRAQSYACTPARPLVNDGPVNEEFDRRVRKDGPMLLHGLQGFHGATLRTPRSELLKPNRDFLAERYDLFKRSA